MNRNEKFNGAWDKSSKFSNILAASKLDNRLLMIPTEISESGEEVVVFNDEIIENRSNKWSLKVCGQFVGCSMTLNEVRYRIRRMWNKFGLKDIIVNESGIFLFKLHDNEGINEVINNGPWMVNNKPMFVHRWTIDVCLDKAEPKKLPVRVKFLKIPMEAWSLKWISALASSLGKPIIMDEVTTRMCLTGEGRVGFARVLKQNENVFTEVNNKRSRGETNANSKNGFGKFGQHRANTFQHRGNNVIKENTKKQNVGMFEYRKINVNEKADEVLLNKGKEKVTKDITSSKERQEKSCMYKEYSGEGSGNGKPQDQAQESNRFSLLDSLINEEDLVPNVKEREEVDVFLKKKLEPTTTDKERWSTNMKRYYRDKKELMDAAEECELEKDVV
uniref:Zinc knuckle CX2CX4HX4C n=1 Tax=Tanacetum cinerariifolium TaxID=118510 RepID=A0A6L2KL04_TANCI|nr:zinc knuckle CX2CX4HX4C [Tanacetum cinerariifolium]